MLSFKTSNFTKTIKLLERYDRTAFNKILDGFGEKGVLALSAATPIDTEETANSWGYHIETSGDKYKLVWTNSKMAGSTPVVILLQYGHATRSGTFISGQDFINPALKPVIAEINKKLQVEVK